MKSIVVASLVLALNVGSFAVAAEKKKELSPEMQDMMVRAQKFGTPGDAHMRLDPMIGDFTYKSSVWINAKAKPEVSTGKGRNTWALGARFLRQENSGKMMDQTFEGVGFIGYDNLRQEYESIWMDNMTTAIMKATGSYDEARNVINFSGTFSCPLTSQKDRPIRSQLIIEGNDKHSFVSWGKDASGKEFKVMEIVYTRAK